MTAIAGDRVVSGGRAPALFLDFDNTIASCDVLDRVIERYSATERWRLWETDWRQGRISTRECLEQQIGDLRVTPAELIRFTDEFAIDQAFAPLLSWAAANGVETAIVSDNFAVIVAAMLERRGFPAVRIYANRLDFDADRPRASFPLRDPRCQRCAHCKAQHVRRVTDRLRVFAGDGLSDICPALAADVAFAKDSLAAHLQAAGRPYRPFRTLTDVLEFLQNALSHV
jgi:2,3-diketo-5-methylthio-1-phosphopentane phosphatase